MFDEKKIVRLCEKWNKSKELEEAIDTARKLVVEERRAIEDQLKELFEMDEFSDDAIVFSVQGFTIKILPRLTYSVDSNRVDELSEEHGLSEHLDKFFYSHRTLNIKNWKSADDRFSSLSEAISIKSSRPSFKITSEKKQTEGFE